jgi:hypothetical protein
LQWPRVTSRVEDLERGYPCGAGVHVISTWSKSGYTQRKMVCVLITHLGTKVLIFLAIKKRPAQKSCRAFTNFKVFLT